MSSQQEPELDELIEALRSDVPSARERARVRDKLVAAGLAVSAGSFVSSAAAAKASAAASLSASAAANGSGAAATAGTSATLAGLPLAAKLSIGAVVIASASALSFAARDLPSEAASAVVPPRSVAVAAAAVKTSEAAPASEHAAPSIVTVPSHETPLDVAVRAPEPSASKPRTAAASSSPRSPDAPRPARAAPTPAPLASPAPATSVLRAEAELLERALGALHAGDLATARRNLAVHAARFPDGALRPERERAQRHLDDAIVATQID